MELKVNSLAKNEALKKIKYSKDRHITLYFNDKKMSADDVIKVLEAIKANKNCTSISLEFAPGIQIPEIENKFANIIKQKKNLASISFSFNWVIKQELKTLQKLSKAIYANKNITVIKLNQYQYEKYKKNDLPKGLSEMKHITAASFLINANFNFTYITMNLKNTMFNNHDLYLLRSHIVINQRLEYLNLNLYSDKFQIDDKSITELSMIINTMKNLKAISLTLGGVNTNTKINKGLNMLSQAIKNHKIFRYIRLDFSEITSINKSTVEKLSEAIFYNKYLKCIDLILYKSLKNSSNNEVEGIKELSKAIIANKNLEQIHLFMACKSFEEHSKNIKEFSNAIINHRYLTKICLRLGFWDSFGEGRYISNLIPHDMKKSFEDTVERNLILYKRRNKQVKTFKTEEILQNKLNVNIMSSALNF